jgi:hypothetical protein
MQKFDYHLIFLVTAASPDVLPVNHRAVRRLFPMEASSTPTSDTKVAHRNTPRSKQINPISTRPTSKQESASGDPDLFSPYKWSREHSQHCYNTRAMATLRQQLTNRGMKILNVHWLTFFSCCIESCKSFAR